jgi:dTDP-4-dehydrorhamnose 3,5-epimerase
MIHGVEIKELVTRADERGFFREVIRVSDAIFPEGFGQWSHTMSYLGVAKAWHVHQKQTDWWYVAAGTIKAEYDGTDEGRIPHDDPEIGYDWTAGPEIT